MSERAVGFDHRDPGLRPFIEVGAKTAIAVLEEGRAEGLAVREIVANLAETAARDAELAARELSEQVEKTRLLTIACREGCAYCCYGAVHASSAEILRVASWAKEKRSPDELVTLRKRAKETAESVATMSLAARAAAKIPCPLLDVESGKCTAYDVRPIPCRAYNSGSVEACKSAFDAGEANPILPTNPALFQVAHACGFGTLTGLSVSGLDVGPYDLATSLTTALEADLDQRWLDGEEVFRHTPLSEEAKLGYDLVLGELATDLREGRLDAAERIAKRLDPEARRRERNRKKRERKGKR